MHSFSSVTNLVNVALKSTHPDFQANIQCLLVDKITSNLPPVDIDMNSWYLQTELAYAHPEFYLSKPIDILLETDLLFNLL